MEAFVTLFLIIAWIVFFVYIIGVIVKFSPSRIKAKLEKEKPEGTDIKLAKRQNEHNISPGWRDMPAVVNSETIALELGWTLNSYMTHQDNQRREVLTAVPDLGNELHPEEIILRRLQFQYRQQSGSKHYWNILLTDKRLLYKFEAKWRDNKPTLQWVASHWYSNIIEVKPEWSADLGSHIEGGGSYVQGWVWQGTGGTWGQQKSTKTVQHQMSCILTVKEQNGEWQKFPFLYINNENLLIAARDFVGMLDKLVGLAGKRSYIEASPARVEVPALNPELIKLPPDVSKTPSGEKGETSDLDKRIAILKRYAALREKGLITEEEYNQQKKKLLGGLQ